MNSAKKLCAKLYCTKPVPYSKAKYCCKDHAPYGKLLDPKNHSDKAKYKTKLSLEEEGLLEPEPTQRKK